MLRVLFDLNGLHPAPGESSGFVPEKSPNACRYRGSGADSFSGAKPYKEFP